MNPRSFTLAGLLALLYACTPDPPPPPQPTPHPLADTLAAVVQDYEALRLPEALARARRLRVMLDTAGAGLPDAVRAETYQYLAMLHYHSTPHFDSIAHYAAAASDALSEDETAGFLARQMLAKAYANYFGQNWIEMDLLCEHGKNVLRAVEVDQVLLGELLILQGKARKQQGDQSKGSGCEKETYQRYWREADSLLRHAEVLLQELDSPWAMTASAERVVLATRPFGSPSTPDVMIRDLGDTYGAAAKDTDRLWAYRYYVSGPQDSAAHYYRRVLQNGTHYSAWDRQEATYVLLAEATASGRYDDAIATLMASMQSSNCCPVGIDAATPDAGLRCNQRLGCISFQSLLSGIYYQQYLETADVRDLERSYALARAAIDPYSAAFRSPKEEGALNRILLQGQRLLDASLRTATRFAALYPTPENLDFVFNTMEVGRNLLLLQDIADSGDSVRDASLARMQIDLNLLKAAHARDRALPPEEIARFVKLTEAYETAAVHIRSDIDILNAAPEFAVPPIESVRSALRSGQALIEFAQTDSELFALYVDSARTELYRIPESAEASIANYQVALHGGSDPEGYDSLANLVFQELLGPVEDALRDHRELLIVPSPMLESLPFSALTFSRATPSGTFASLDYLLDHLSVRYLESWRVREQLEQPARAVPTTGPVAGIWTHPSLESYLGDLAASLLEYSDGESDHYQGAAVNNSTLLENAGRYDLLHLSVHARGNASVLYDNYLFLNPTDSLNGVRIGGLSLPADLVVLAACSTARGYTGRGEGTFSLRRSFHIAGVPYVVSSFYDISATTTAGILERFYRYHLGEGDEPAMALTRALRDCRAGRLNKRWTNPVYWAGLLVG